MLNRFTNFIRRDEDAAVTVDFVVLTAGLLLLATFIVSTISNGLFNFASDIDTALSAISGFE